MRAHQGLMEQQNMLWVILNTTCLVIANSGGFLGCHPTLRFANDDFKMTPFPELYLPVLTAALCWHGLDYFFLGE